MHLAFENVKKNYGKKEALKGVSFELTEGIYGLLGPNGAGKSTLMNIMTGNLSATSGRILADGIDICKAGHQFAGKIGYMPQQAFYPGFSAERFMFYIASLQKMDKKTASERISGLLEKVGLYMEILINKRS
ncbi:MAG: ATP-binding cassette domain-containing protein [Lachnospiraceae bacterium]|nr:ATP-binding cassette domain-containing protein [Lachnospiraceae bacterium]